MLELGQVIGRDIDGDTITYSMLPGLLDHDLFEIDETTGQLSIRDGENDFEHSEATDGVFSIIIELQSTSSLPAENGGAASLKRVNAAVRIQLTDVNEAVTDLTLSDPNLAQGETLVGTLQATDPDQKNDHIFTLTGTGNDNHLFRIDKNTSTLHFIGSASDRRAPEQTYEVEVTVADGDFTITRMFTIAEEAENGETLYITTDDDLTLSDDIIKNLLHENTDAISGTVMQDEPHEYQEYLLGDNDFFDRIDDSLLLIEEDIL